MDSKCLLRESPEAYAAYCKAGPRSDEQRNPQECREEAERARQAKMAGVMHRLYDLRLVLLRGLDSEPLEVLDDVLRLLEEASDAPATANASE